MQQVRQQSIDNDKLSYENFFILKHRYLNNSNYHMPNPR
jgi:hypothetical protein